MSLLQKFGPMDLYDVSLSLCFQIWRISHQLNEIQWHEVQQGKCWVLQLRWGSAGHRHSSWGALLSLQCPEEGKCRGRHWALPQEPMAGHMGTAQSCARGGSDWTLGNISLS